MTSSPATPPRPAARFQLHLITEPRRTPDALLAAVEAALGGGVDWVQLRDKQASAASMYRQALELRRQAHDRRARLTINDRLDAALAVGADGVHLAGQSLPVAAASPLARASGLLLGRSVHSLAEAVDVAHEGADYVTFGHVFPSNSKPGLPPRGLQELAAIVQAVDIPVLAIGGIGLDNLDGVLATGCAGIAVITAILAAPDPRSAARRLRDALDASPHQPRHAFPSAGIPAPPEAGTGASYAPHRQSTSV